MMAKRRQTAIGIALLLTGIALGYGLRFVDLRIVYALRSVIAGEDSGRLLLLATEVTGLNALRVLPLYMGAFVLMEQWVPVTGPFSRRAAGYGIPVLLVPASYWLIRILFQTPYDFGVPAMLSLLGVIGMHLLSQFPQGLFWKAATFGMFSFGWQWLGLVPGLTRYGFGNGDLSIDVKNAAAFLGQEALLARWSSLSCAVFVSIAVTMAKFMVDYSNHVDLLRRHQAQQLEMRQAALRNLEIRSRAEMQRLVHDLKTPLTTIQGLVSLIGMTQDKAKTAEYVARVEQAVDRMDRIISEILYPETRRHVSGAELVRFLRSHVSGVHWSGVRFDVGEDLPDVEVNVVRMTRAVANLIQNAREAVQDTGAPVVVRVRNDAGKLRIEVIDGGPGISREVMDQLFTPGFSTKESSGLGLSFAREVIAEEHGGSLEVYSKPGEGTTIVVELMGGVQ
ncbi:MAG: HAMP domain-containing histidine kinase [Firmicutes bacterium]|nr:HAMP domain-containing histidine kinase [Bacillota bacterium]